MHIYMQLFRNIYMYMVADADKMRSKYGDWRLMRHTYRSHVDLHLIGMLREICVLINVRRFMEMCICGTHHRGAVSEWC